MPPKKQQQPKKDKAKKEKAAEDKTFGMKNKNKSAKVQRYIQQVNSQTKHNIEQGKGPSVSIIIDMFMKLWFDTSVLYR